MSASLTGKQGALLWAISAFEPQDPFRVAAGDGTERRVSARDLAREVRQRTIPGQFELIVPAKLRPVLLLQDRPAGRFDDFAALRLMRLETFAAADQARIRDGHEPTLFHLARNERQYGLSKEYAVLLTSLHRVHASAIASPTTGRLNVSEFRTVCERLVRVCDLDISNLIVQEAAAFVERLKGG